MRLLYEGKAVYRGKDDEAFRLRNGTVHWIRVSEMRSGRIRVQVGDGYVRPRGYLTYDDEKEYLRKFKEKEVRAAWRK